MAEGDPAPQPRDTAALTDREKATLRLLLAGHDAKSIARELGLSVHTVNERLRDARRKLGVASSREAARLLAAREGAAPEKLGDTALGVPAAPLPMASPVQGEPRHWPGSRLAWLSGGMLIMSLLIALAAFALNRPATPVVQTPVPSAASEAASLGDAKAWLALVDQGRWDQSWQAASTLFRGKITAKGWETTIQPVRQPLGPVVSRAFQAVTKTNTLPGAPAADYEILIFQTRFEQRGNSIETVILMREGTAWRVAGYFIRPVG